MATKDAGEVPFNLNLSVNPYQKYIRVEMDGWVSRDNPPPPHHRGGRGRGRGRHGGGGPRNQARRALENCQNRANGGNRANGQERALSSAGSNWTRTAQEWIANLHNSLVQAGAFINKKPTESIWVKVCMQ